MFSPRPLLTGWESLPPLNCFGTARATRRSPIPARTLGAAGRGRSSPTTTRKAMATRHSGLTAAPAMSCSTTSNSGHWAGRLPCRVIPTFPPRQSPRPQSPPAPHRSPLIRAAPLVLLAAGSGSSCSTNRIDNTSSNNVITTNLTIIGSDFTFDGTYPVTITNFPSGSGTISGPYICFSDAPNYGSYTGAVILDCNNG